MIRDGRKAVHIMRMATYEQSRGFLPTPELAQVSGKMRKMAHISKQKRQTAPTNKTDDQKVRTTYKAVGRGFYSWLSSKPVAMRDGERERESRKG